MRRFFKSFTLAARGIAESVSTGRNLRVQMVVGAYALAFAPFFLNSKTEWAVLMVIIAMVLIAEIFNTALELLIDQASPAYSQLARAAKDAAAGAVLLCACFSVIVGILLFAHKEGFDKFLNFCAGHIWCPVLFALTLVPSVLFIVFGFKKVKKR